MNFKLAKDVRTEKFNKHYNFAVGSCHAAMALRHDYVKQLRKFRQDIPVSYVRFHGVFNDDMHTLDTFENVFDKLPGGNKYVERNFNLVGVAYDNLLECGVKPFVELSYMPELLAKEKTTTKGFYGSNFNEPRDYEEWRQYIIEFIEFLIGRYGAEEVRTWFFEVWNEPDLKGAFFNGDKDAYFKLYKTTAEAIKSVDSLLKVGGPSTSASKWIDSFVKYCKHENIPLDFVSTHQYPGDPFIGVNASEGLESEIKKVEVDNKAAKFAEMMNHFASKIPAGSTPLEIIRMMFGDPTETKNIRNNIFRDNAKIVQSQAQGLPVYYSEWNLTATFSAYSNDTRKAASYLVKTALDVEPYLAGSSVWCFSDLFEEMHQFKEEFHGGFGLQTLHGIPKPSYHAMKLLSSLPQERCILEADETDQEITFAAFSDEEKTVLLFVRHKMKTEGQEFYAIQVDVEIDHQPNSLTMQRIDETHCNPLKLWENNGRKKYINPNEIEDIIDNTKLTTESVEYSYDEGAIHFDLNLGINDVYFITIQK